jgi:hypothetical protein
LRCEIPEQLAAVTVIKACGEPTSIGKGWDVYLHRNIAGLLERVKLIEANLVFRQPVNVHDAPHKEITIAGIFCPIADETARRFTPAGLFLLGRLLVPNTLMNLRSMERRWFQLVY